MPISCLLPSLLLGQVKGKLEEFSSALVRGNFFWFSFHVLQGKSCTEVSQFPVGYILGFTYTFIVCKECTRFLRTIHCPDL